MQIIRRPRSATGRGTVASFPRFELHGTVINLAWHAAMDSRRSKLSMPFTADPPQLLAGHGSEDSNSGFVRAGSTQELSAAVMSVIPNGFPGKFSKYLIHIRAISGYTYSRSRNVLGGGVFSLTAK